MIPDLFDDIRLYLPKYLSEDQQKNLFDELAAFPGNLDKRFYTTFLKDEPILFQGDGFQEVMYPDYDKNEFRKVKGFLISNTCDSFLGNERLFAPFISLAPIFSLQKWEKFLKAKFTPQQVQSHLDAIRSQKVTQFFYLPKQNDDEMFVRFDCVFSFPINEATAKELLAGRLFTLSNYGFYVLLIKLGIHLSRVQERVDRDKSPTAVVLQ